MGAKCPDLLFQKLPEFNKRVMLMLPGKGFGTVLKLILFWVVDKIPHSDANHLPEFGEDTCFLKKQLIRGKIFVLFEMMGLFHPFRLKPWVQFFKFFYNGCSLNIQKKDILQVTEKFSHRRSDYVCKTPYKSISGMKEMFSLFMLPFTKTNFLSNT